jgi:exodeoxyribonuclease X
MKLIFLDTESTGNDIKKDRLCQVCFQVDENIFTEYFKPPIPISIKAMSITHITNKMVEDKPSFEGSEMKNKLQDLLQEGVLVAHNANFDIGILENEGMKIPKSICTLKLARFFDADCIVPEYNLQFLRYYLNIEIEGNAHDAEGDVKVLKAVFDRLFSKMRKDEENDEAVISKMIEISSKPSMIRKFFFGKYKGQKVEDIAKSDSGYLDWLLKSKLESPDDEEDWIYTINHFQGKML